jgi:plastocyanin
MKWIVGRIGLFLFVFSAFLILPGQSQLLAEEGNGGLTGNILFSGIPPKIVNETVTQNVEICGNQIQVEPLIVNPDNHGVKNILVSLKNKLEETISNAEMEPLDINNVKCRIEPSAMEVRVNQIVNIRNSDPIFHSLQFMNKERLIFDAALPKNSSNALKRKFNEPGVIRVRCAVHPFMQGAIYVIDTPHHVFTDKNGTFRITEVKPGRYLMKVWHKSLKPIEREIEILPGKNSSISLSVEKSEE